MLRHLTKGADDAAVKANFKLLATLAAKLRECTYGSKGLTVLLGLEEITQIQNITPMINKIKQFVTQMVQNKTKTQK